MNRRRWLFAGIAFLAATALACSVYWHFRTTAPTEETITRITALGMMVVEEENGLYVLAVTSDSRADRAGMEPGDRLLRANDVKLTSVTQLEEVMRSTPPDVFRLTVQRGDTQTVTLYLTLR